jgi:transposase
MVKLRRLLSKIQKTVLVDRYQQGARAVDLTKSFKVPKQTVSDILKKYRTTGTIERKPGSGRPRKTTALEDRLIIRTMLSKRDITAHEIADSVGINGVSDKTICRRLTQSGEFKSCWKTRKPFITEKNRRIRVEWSQEHLHWTVEQWRKVLWSDESSYVLRYAQRTQVWRRKNERYKPFATTATVKHDKKIMVWGAFAAHGVGNIYRVEGMHLHVIHTNYHSLTVVYRHYG